MTEKPEPAVARRLTWLLGVPVASSFVPWVLWWAGTTVGTVGPLGLALLGAVPLLGVLASRLYARAAYGQVHWWPLAPYAVSAATFLVLLVSALRMREGDGLEFVPVLVIGFFQPGLALVGGFICFVWVRRPPTP